MIIGLTGTKGSGKGIVADFLKRKGFFYISTSDLVREEAKKRGLKNYKTKDLQDIGDELRKKFGKEELVKRCFDLAKNEKNIVIDGIRNLGELEEIKRRQGIIIAVDAPKEERFKRILERGRESDPKTFEEFEIVEKRDRESETEFGQQVNKCLEKADYLIINNGNFEELQAKIEKIIDKKSNRPSWDEYFIGICDSVSQRATCDRGKSGCVIVRDKQILVTGYVGSPRGFSHCDEVGHLLKKTIHSDGSISTHCVRTVHAEQNAICQAAKLGISLDGSTIYCKMTPCRTCSMLLVNCGIKRVVCKKKYKLAKESEEILKEAGIEIFYMSEEFEEYPN